MTRDNKLTMLGEKEGLDCYIFPSSEPPKLPLRSFWQSDVIRRTSMVLNWRAPNGIWTFSWTVAAAAFRRRLKEPFPNFLSESPFFEGPSPKSDGCPPPWPLLLFHVQLKLCSTYKGLSAVAVLEHQCSMWSTSKKQRAAADESRLFLGRYSQRLLLRGRKLWPAEKFQKVTNLFRLANAFYWAISCPSLGNASP